MLLHLLFMQKRDLAARHTAGAPGGVVARCVPSAARIWVRFSAGILFLGLHHPGLTFLIASPGTQACSSMLGLKSMLHATLRARIGRGVRECDSPS